MDRDDASAFEVSELSAEGLVGELTRWLADSRVDAAATSRARERWLRQQAGEEALFAGVLLDLAERGSMVLVHAAGSRRHRGRVRAVADDFCALRSEEGADVLLAYNGIVSVQPHGEALVATGDRPSALDMTLGEALAAMVGDRPRVLVVTHDGAGMAGELRAVGRDVVTLRPDGDARVSYVPLRAVAEVSIPR